MAMFDRLAGGALLELAALAMARAAVARSTPEGEDETKHPHRPTTGAGANRPAPTEDARLGDELGASGELAYRNERNR
jgi:hypothetical protein